MKLQGNLFRYSLMAITFVGITGAAWLSGCAVYRVVPLYVSLVVMFLQTRASRFSFLLGGCNAAYYAGVYVFLGLYGMALYSILMACPIQIVTYVRWKRRADSQGTRLKRLSVRQRLYWVLGAGAVWGILFMILSAFGSGYIILDNSLAVIGAISNIASMLCLIEFAYIQCVVQVLNIVLYVQMIGNDPRQWTFLIYTVYALACALISGIYMQKLYNKQNSR